jgi:peptide deformylase
MREILQDPNDVLRQKAQKISIADISSKKIQEIISDMKDVLESEQFGVAIAAPQVGESLGLFVVAGKVFAARKSEEYDPKKHASRVYINPKITSTSKKKEELQEGCLSVRGKWGKVQRSERVTIEAYDKQGKKFTLGASGLLAQIFQHEIDHLDGILYIDKAIDVWDDEKEEENNHEKS